ncbi:MAG: deoxyguanosinetriphosphate triphosphohydrolase [Trueperaceae bacterium]|nr:deoxyguanosinetriphosphate triphosphohydrolase [Trueperaceae bacterium]
MIVSREMLEQAEVRTLAPYACMAVNSRGRIHNEGESAYRTAFQKDRDRVLHTSAFRRLEYKTQVFVNFEGDYYRTRLTHTLEVAQVATSIARALGLNEDLSETIALAHDLGHPPFGHSGEKALDTLMKGEGGFDHNRQSLRIVTEIERRYPSFPGLNLTWETLEGIMKHETEYDVPDARFEPDIQPSLEAQVVNSADEVAYNVHDLDDGLRSGHLTAKQISEVPLVGSLIRELGIDVNSFDGPARYLLTRELLGLIITDIVTATDERLREHGIETLDDVRNASTKLLGPSQQLGAQLAELKAFLYQNFYFHHRLIRMSKKAHMILERMFTAYLAAPDMLPPAVRRDAQELGLKRALTDYLSGMTDRYAVEEYRRLFEPAVLT